MGKAKKTDVPQYVETHRLTNLVTRTSHEPLVPQSQYYTVWADPVVVEGTRFNHQILWDPEQRTFREATPEEVHKVRNIKYRWQVRKSTGLLGMSHADEQPPTDRFHEVIEEPPLAPEVNLDEPQMRVWTGKRVEVVHPGDVETVTRVEAVANMEEAQHSRERNVGRLDRDVIGQARDARELANLNILREAVKLPPLTAEEYRQQLETLILAGEAGK